MNATKTRCEVVDQIVTWTDAAGELQVHVGDLVLHDGTLEQLAVILEEPSFTGHMFVRFDGSDVWHPKRPNDLVAVRRYVETPED